MTQMLWHQLPIEAGRLARKVEHLIAQLPLEDRTDFDGLVRLQPHSVPRLVLTGQYSSGKSSLISAITDGAAEVVIDSDIATDSVADYDWDGAVTLVDTPGVQAGISHHDDLAQAAIRSADLLLFTVSVDLFDDPLTDHLKWVADTLGKREQMMIVITKSGTMTAAEGIRAAAVRAADPGSPQIPFLECDASDYLRGIRHADEARGGAYRASSGIDVLRAAINALAAERGELAILRQPFQQIKSVAAEAQSRITENPEERAALALLARQRRAVSSRAQRIDTQLAQLRTEFRSSCVEAAEVFADQMESIDDLPLGTERDERFANFQQTLCERLDGAATTFGSDIGKMLVMQFDDLASEIKEIEASPHAKLVLRLGDNIPEPDFEGFEHTQSPPRTSGNQRYQPPDWAGQVREWLGNFQSFWGAGGGPTASSGSNGHKIVLDVGHMFGKKFKPWEAVGVADKIGKAATAANYALPVATAVAAVAIEERARVQAERRRAIARTAMIMEVVNQAEAISRRADNEVRKQLRPAIERAYEQIDHVTNLIHQAQEQRSELANGFLEVQRECDAVLSTLQSVGG